MSCRIPVIRKPTVKWHWHEVSYSGATLDDAGRVGEGGRLLRVVQLGPAHAAALAEAVAAVLPDLVQFQQRLRLRGERDEAPDAVRHGFARDERRD